MATNSPERPERREEDLPWSPGPDADDARPPHAWLFPGDAAKQRVELARFLSLARGFDRGEKIGRVRFAGLRLWLGHPSSPCLPAGVVWHFGGMLESR